MSLSDQTSDWQVSGRLQIAAGTVASAGLYLFDFYSPAANGTALFVFSGYGVGVGVDDNKPSGFGNLGNASGGGLPGTIGDFGPWSSITCDKPFSVWDLNGAWGRIARANIGVGLTFGPVFISGTQLLFHRFLFPFPECRGLWIWRRRRHMVLLGKWSYKRVTNRIPPDANPYSDYA